MGQLIPTERARSDQLRHSNVQNHWRHVLLQFPVLFQEFRTALDIVLVKNVLTLMACQGGNDEVAFFGLTNLSLCH